MTSRLCLIDRNCLDKRGGGGKVDVLDHKISQDIIDDCFEQYLTASAAEDAKEKGYNTRHNLCLRLQDLATFIEADQAMRAGDIGRVLLMWKQWSIMAQGIKGLSHYGFHLPRLVLLLEKYLPPSLAHVLKHSMLILASGRDGHFISKDLHLEYQNFLLKYCYNHSVSFSFQTSCCKLFLISEQARFSPFL